jgi:hypothetical protein
MGFINNDEASMVLPLKTRSAARAIGATAPQIMSAIYSGKLLPPGKDESGDYQWFPHDLERAKAALAIDRRKHRPEVQPA